MQNFLVPVQEWEPLTECYSSDLAATQAKNKPIGVRTVRYGGFLFTCFGILHCPIGHKSSATIEAWKLIPIALYKGETVSQYHDEDAIQAGTRERGCFLGLIVSVKGHLMVCSENVRFIKAAPTTTPISQLQAKQFNESQARYGWRALGKRQPTEWTNHYGHPVVTYIEDGEPSHVLFYFHKNQLQEVHLDSTFNIQPLETALNFSINTTAGQLALLFDY